MVSYATMMQYYLAPKGLNPYCSGRWSRTLAALMIANILVMVLILIVVEDGLVLSSMRLMVKKKHVLILIVVEDGLVLGIVCCLVQLFLVLILIVVEDGLVLDLIRLY